MAFYRDLPKGAKVRVACADAWVSLTQNYSRDRDKAGDYSYTLYTTEYSVDELQVIEDRMREYLTNLFTEKKTALECIQPLQVLREDLLKVHIPNYAIFYDARGSLILNTKKGRIR